MKAKPKDEISAGELAKMVGLSVRWLKQLADAGAIPPAVRGKYPMPDTTKALVTFYRDEARNAKTDPLKAVRRMLLEDKLRLNRGQLVEVDAIRREIARAYSETKQHLLAVPGQLTVRCGIPQRAATMANELIRDALETLSKLKP
jgi:hypothetical protein